MREARSILRSSSVLLSLAMLAAASIACKRGINPDLEPNRVVDGQIEHGGRRRSYRLLVPEAIDTDQTYPLVLALHGGGGDGERMCSLKGGIQELAADERFFVLCPSGVDRHWNDGREIDRWQAHAERIDDVGFLVSLVEMMVKVRPVDPERVYVTGMSNGGKMSFRLACETQGVFAAGAAVIASLPTDLRCEPAGPISIMIMNGTEDPLVPWEGGQVNAFGQPLGGIHSTPDTVAFWIDHNQCDPRPERTRFEDRETSDGSRVSIERYSGCSRGELVEIVTVYGGGHTWPGGIQYLPEFLIGRTNRDVHAGDLIWDFFVRVAP